MSALKSMSILQTAVSENTILKLLGSAIWEPLMLNFVPVQLVDVEILCRMTLGH